MSHTNFDYYIEHLEESYHKYRRSILVAYGYNVMTYVLWALLPLETGPVLLWYAVYSVIGAILVVHHVLRTRAYYLHMGEQGTRLYDKVAESGFYSLYAMTYYEVKMRYLLGRRFNPKPYDILETYELPENVPCLQDSNSP